MNNKLRISLIVPILTLALNALAMTGLKDIARPYLGTYECKYARLGEDDLLKSLDYIRFELLPKDVFKIEFKDKNGVKGLYRGHYTFSEKNGEITINENIFGKKVKKTFSAENGAIQVNLKFGDAPLSIKFEMS